MAWTLRKKILLGYGIPFILMVFVLVWTIVHLLDLGRASDSILRDNYKSILAAENMIDAVERQDSGSLLLILGYETEGLKQFRENESKFLQWFGRAKDNITIEGEDKIIESIDTSYSYYLVQFSKLRSMHRITPGESNIYYHETLLPAFTSIRTMCEQLRDMNQTTMFMASERAENIAKKAIWSVSIVGFVSLCVGLLFSMMLSNFLVRPLRQMVDATKVISEGDYETTIRSISSDELGLLAKGFNDMVAKLKKYHDLNVSQLVTEKRKSEAIIQSIDDGIIVIDSNLKITGVNPVASNILGVQSEAVQSRHFLEVIKSDNLFQYLKQTLETKQTPSIEEGKNIFTIKKDDKRNHYQFSITPVFDKAGDMIGAVLLLRDVTRLKELDRLKSEFVMAASHELKTPLTGIEMSIELLKEKAAKKLNPKEQQLLDAAQEETQRLEALIKDLLDLSRIEAGKMEMDFAFIGVGILIEKAFSVIKNQAQEKSVELSQEIPENLPNVRADANKITWVMTNLIANALRYTESGGHIHLSAKASGKYISISVADDGTGIPYEYQAKIFDKFVQVKGANEAGGSGLGLAISKEIIRAHGGTIWVDSTPGEGSVFTFTLPLAE